MIHLIMRIAVPENNERRCFQELSCQRPSLRDRRNMATIKIYDLLRRRALVTRKSARAIKDFLVVPVDPEGTALVLDFSGIEAVTPSFVDEIITVLGETASVDRTGLRVVFLNPPTRLSGKFLAIARRHGLHIIESSPETWTITKDAPAAEPPP